MTFQVSCIRVWEFAFFQGGSVFVASADGAEVELVGNGTEPAWSPDGTRLAYSCGGICIVHFDGRETFRIPPLFYGYEASPAWRPDGSQIALVSYDCGYGYYYDCFWAGLYLADPNGSNRRRVPLPTGVTAWDVTWSPDGTTLAFTCTLGGTPEICLVARDGSGFGRLTTDPADGENPAWSPDGSSIAFHTSRFGEPHEIVRINPESRAVTRLAPGSMGLDPAWSPDGQKIVFRGGLGLFVMNADGTGWTLLTTGSHSQPAWRP